MLGALGELDWPMALLLMAVVGVVVVTVLSSLRPLRVVSHQTSMLSLHSLGERLHARNLPRELAPLVNAVREGVPLSRALGAGKQFPPMLIHMIASGEATGELSEMLERAAQTMSQEVERRTLTLTTLLEPILILIMGGIVLMIVLAVLLPIIEINQLVK